MAALQTKDVLREEAKAIHGIKNVPDENFYVRLGEADSAALCLSGGGIRSAAFALGVIGALATHPRNKNGAAVDSAEKSLLAQFQYLSTVSGGGYIGSWLSAWIARESWSNAWQNLTRRPRGPDVEPAQLSWLRDYSSYLTPRVGVTSADTWAAAAIIMRNLLLNWLVIIPTIGIGVICLKWFAGFVKALSTFEDKSAEIFLLGVSAVGFATLILALQFAIRNRPALGNSSATQGRFIKFDLLPTLIALICFALALVIPETNDLLRKLPTCTSSSSLSSHSCLLSLVEIHATGAIVIYAASWMMGAWLFSRQSAELQRAHLWDLTAWLAGALVSGALIGCGIWLFLNEVEHSYFIGLGALKSTEIILILLAVPWGILSLLIGEMIFIGLSSREKNSDSDREWFGRSAGWFMTLATLWLVAGILVFLGSDLAQFGLGYARAWLAGAGGISGLITGLLGKSSTTPRKGKAKTLPGISANILLVVAAPIFAAILIVGISMAVDEFAFGMPMTETAFWNAKVMRPGQPFVFPAEFYWLLLWTAIIVGVSLVAGWAINVNRFSLHALYRNRIIRAFLGGSRSDRSPNRFTDFDPSDNLRMWQLWPQENAKKGWQPFHVVNMALNIVSAKKLAWQQRKAESFTSTPLHTGSACLNPDVAGQRVGAYRNSECYGDPDGISLGTAVAISGAAASSNMGYHSSTSVSFLMTLLNARLGWWLRNPGPQGGSDADLKLDGPRLAWLPLFNEMLGLTTDDRPYIYLSDGGHFENLALYEMVRRRCRFIVVSDAGCDPNFEFEDLGNAIRKISIDLGVAISIPKLNLLKNRDEDRKANPSTPTFYAIGTIDYSADGPGARKGIILYVKPFFRDAAIEDVGVRNYAVAHKTFPHQDTSDQWFDEPQFESYRRLGFEITDKILTKATIAGASDLGGVLTKLQEASA